MVKLERNFTCTQKSQSLKEKITLTQNDFLFPLEFQRKISEWGDSIRPPYRCAEEATGNRYLGCWAVKCSPFCTITSRFFTLGEHCQWYIAFFSKPMVHFFLGPFQQQSHMTRKACPTLHRLVCYLLFSLHFGRKRKDAIPSQVSACLLFKACIMFECYAFACCLFMPSLGWSESKMILTKRFHKVSATLTDFRLLNLFVIWSLCCKA